MVEVAVMVGVVLDAKMEDREVVIEAGPEVGDEDAPPPEALGKK